MRKNQKRKGNSTGSLTSVVLSKSTMPFFKKFRASRRFSRNAAIKRLHFAKIRVITKETSKSRFAKSSPICWIFVRTNSLTMWLPISKNILLIKWWTLKFTLLRSILMLSLLSYFLRLNSKWGSSTRKVENTRSGVRMAWSLGTSMLS